MRLTLETNTVTGKCHWNIKSLRRFFLTSSAASVALIAFVLYVAYPVRQK